MSDEELTPWFPGSERPARPGWYVRLTSSGWGEQMAMWDGKCWLLDLDAVTGEMMASGYQPYVYGGGGFVWRGLAKEPK